MFSVCSEDAYDVFRQLATNGRHCRLFVFLRGVETVSAVTEVCVAFGYRARAQEGALIRDRNQKPKDAFWIFTGFAGSPSCGPFGSVGMIPAATIRSSTSMPRTTLPITE